MDQISELVKENRIYQISLYSVIFVVVFGIFHWYSFLSSLVVFLTVGYVSFCIFSGLWNILLRFTVEDLQEKAVFITGCDSGFGHETAKSLDRLSVKVYAGCFQIDSEGAHKLRKECSSNLEIIPLDVRSQEDVDNSLKVVQDSLTKNKKELFAVINNAGIASPAPLEWVSMETYQNVINVNTFGAIRVTKAFLPLIRKSRGRVVNISSFGGRISPAILGPYGLSKAALINFSDILRRELHHWPVSVHTVEPLFYKTPMSNLQYMTEYLHECYHNLPKDVQQSYGLNYVQDAKTHVCKMDWFIRPSSKINEVVEDIVDAAVGRHPKICYFPGFGTEFALNHVKRAPVWLIDTVLRIVSPIKENSFLRK